ncbi:kinase-like protein [Gigaspora margarita]|uniref:Kinase-like protein n=1 Tax=Gigaspora margarita TaxID=4874 RepID=A0A8H4A291_GIGMA|nr:kinase-like protein [Gigaspora margarita]
MVLQYANEGDLQQYLKLEAKKLQWSKKLNIAMGIACGLSFLHDKGIIHRDLHSKNILIHHGKPKISDFGASKQINRASMTSDSAVIGVIEYTDPHCIVLNNIIRDEAQIEEGMKNLEGAQLSDLESNRGGEILAQASDGKKEIENVEGDVQEAVDRYLTSKDKLTSHDKEILEDAANEFLINQENTLLIKKVNTLKDKKSSKASGDGGNAFLESPNERMLKNAIYNFLENTLVLEGKLFLKNKLILGRQITVEDEKTLKKASRDKKDFVTTVNELLTLKAKEVLETAINELLTLKRKKVLLILGSGGTGKSTFNRYARRLWECAKNDMTQSIPLFIALAPLEGLINKNQDFIEAYLRERGKLSPDQIKELRNRNNMFTEWKNAKIIFSCRPEYLDEGSGERFWPKENGKKDLRKSGTSQINRIVLYEEFIKKWFERAKERLQKIQLKKEEKEEFVRLKECFTNHCLQFGKEFTFKILSRANKQLPENLSKIRVPGADLHNGDFNNFQFVRANLNKVNFHNAILQSTNFEDAFLQAANLQNAELQDVNLTGAYLTGANLQRANLRNAKLQNANLESASLQYVNLKGAYLTDANLRHSLWRCEFSRFLSQKWKI